MKKTAKWILVAVGVVLGAAIVFVAVSCLVYPPQYIFRCILNLEGDVMDYKIFPARIIEKSASPYRYQYALDDTFGGLTVQNISGGQIMESPLGKLAEENGTASLIVVHDDKVVYEKYFNGYDKDSVNTSFSSVKSLDSLMIGMAIEDGYIQSEEQPISDFIPEFKGTEFADVTIRQLLTMRSKIQYKEGGLWFGDNAKTYYWPDLRDLALRHMSVDESYSGQFLYNNYHPLLLGIILERSTGRSVSEYFQEKIWDKVGAEHDASWSLDSNATQFEKMESGLNFKAIDYVKIGSMLLRNGQWNGQTVIGEDWLKRSLYAQETIVPGSIIYYQYMWYSIENTKGGRDFFASGKFGQYIYVSPDNDTVVLRTGKNEGKVDVWPYVLMQIADYAASK